MKHSSKTVGSNLKRKAILMGNIVTNNMGHAKTPHNSQMK